MGTQASPGSFPALCATAPISLSGQGGRNASTSLPPITSGAVLGGVDGHRTAEGRMSSNLDEFEFGNDGGRQSLDEFEFGTGERFLELEAPVGNDGGRQKWRRRGDSLPAMAFADELFVNGRVMPLKLPPRLQSDGEFTSFNKLPKSPRTVWRIPFVGTSWKDDFDPFMVALDKVREENRGHHRRSRSYSPFMDMPKKYSNNFTDSSNGDFSKGNSSTDTTQAPAPRHTGPLDFRPSLRGFFSEKRLGSLKIQDGPDMPTSPTQKRTKSKKQNSEESKVQKLKGFLLRFGKEVGGLDQTKAKASSETQKVSHFSRLGFRFKGNRQHRCGKDSVPS